MRNDRDSAAGPLTARDRGVHGGDLGAVLLGLVLNAAAGWWWADPAAGYVLVYYAAREVREIFTAHDDAGPGDRG